jgi:branched-chain amino acid aminotransferase
MSLRFCNIDGELVSLEKASISLLDLSFSRGYAIFDFFRTYHRKPFHLKDHLQRLRYGASSVYLDFPLSFEQIKKRIDELIHAIPQEELGIKIFLTAGESTDPLFPEGNEKLLILGYPISSYSKTVYEKGIALATLKEQRPLPKVKSSFYLSAASFLFSRKKEGVQEILYTSGKEEILEGGTSNFFAFIENRLVSCSGEAVLIGITQKVIERLAMPFFSVESRLIHLKEIPLFEEAFICSSTKEIMPVIAIDGKPIGSGRVGPKTERLRALFKEYTEGPDWPNLNISRYSD